MGKVTRGTEILRGLIKKHPEAGARTLARMAYELNPGCWKNLETCRSSLRGILGLHGAKRLAQRKDKSLVRAPRPAGWTCTIPAAVVQLEGWKAFDLPGKHRTLILSDVHIPFHSAEALELALDFGREKKCTQILLNGDIADHYCVGLGTRVLTSDWRWVPAETLRIGDGVIGFDEMPSARHGGGRKLRKTVVTDTGIKPLPMHEIELDDGTILHSTDQHRWIVDNGESGWIRTDKLTTRNRSATRLNRFFKPWHDAPDRWHCGYLAAAFDGEGTISGSRLAFAQTHNAMLNRVKKELASCGFAFYEKDYESGTRPGFGTKRISHIGISGGTQEVLRFLGQIRPERLRENYSIEGQRLEAKDRIRVVRNEYIGIQPAVTLSTGTKTYIAEGFGAHNTISRWQTDPGLRDFPGEVLAIKKFLGGLRKNFPKARIIYKHGNHEERYSVFMQHKCPEFLGLEQFEWGNVFSLPENKVELVHQKRPITLGKLNVIHGHEYSFNISNPVNPARGLFLRGKCHAICGHFHQTSQHSEKTLEQSVVSSWSTGCLCDLNPEYRPMNNWNLGFAYCETSADGAFEVHNVRVIGGKVYA